MKHGQSLFENTASPMKLSRHSSPDVHKCMSCGLVDNTYHEIHLAAFPFISSHKRGRGYILAWLHLLRIVPSCGGCPCSPYVWLPFLYRYPDILKTSRESQGWWWWTLLLLVRIDRITYPPCVVPPTVKDVLEETSSNFGLLFRGSCLEEVAFEEIQGRQKTKTST